MQDWILKSENGFCVSLLNRWIQDLSSHGASKEPKNPFWKWILRFLLTHHDPRDLGFICLIEKHKIRFRILSDLRTQSTIYAPLDPTLVPVPLACSYKCTCENIGPFKGARVSNCLKTYGSTTLHIKIQSLTRLLLHHARKR